MNILEMVKRVLNWQDWKKASALPGWRARPTMKKKDRTPFASSRSHKIAECQQNVEEFLDKEKRDERFRELRAKRASGLAKFSTVRANRSVWCVVHGHH